DVDVAPILPPACRLEPGDHLAGADPAVEIARLRFVLGADDRHAPTGHLLGGPPEDPLRTRIPRQDAVLEIDFDDRDRGRLDHGAETLLTRAQLDLLELAIGDIDAAGEDADHRARLVLDRRASPRDHAPFAAEVRERVLVLRRRELRGRCL